MDRHCLPQQTRRRVATSGRRTQAIRLAAGADTRNRGHSERASCGSAQCILAQAASFCCRWSGLDSLRRALHGGSTVSLWREAGRVACAAGTSEKDTNGRRARVLSHKHRPIAVSAQRVSASLDDSPPDCLQTSSLAPPRLPAPSRAPAVCCCALFTSGHARNPAIQLHHAAPVRPIDLDHAVSSISPPPPPAL